MKKIISFSAIAAISCAAQIGVIMPLTGPVAAYGQSCLAGIKLANAMRPTLKNGEKIELKITDNKGDKIESLNAAERLMDGESLGIIGAMLTANTLVVINSAEKKHVPIIAPAATSDKLLKNKTYAARVCFNDSFQGVKMAEHLIQSELKRAVIIKDQGTDYSLGLSKAFKKKYLELGGEVVKEFTITGGDKDFSAIASALASTDADVVYAPIYYQEASLFVSQARQAGVKLPFAGSDGVADEQFINLAKEAAEGYIYTDSFDASVPPTELSKSFIAEHEKTYNSADVANFTAMGADAYFVMLDAANRCLDAGSLDSECLNKEIKNTKDFEGVSGLINIDAAGETKRSLIIKQITNAKAKFLKQM